MCKDHYPTYSELLMIKRAELLTLKTDAWNMYAHKLCPVYIGNIFNTHSTSYSLRQSDFSVPRYNTVIYGHSLRYPLDQNYEENCLLISDQQKP